jgi:hypothetical protein
VETWNRKLHMYVGLYFLTFLWLFAFSGLLLNHPKWKFTQFWEQRKQSVSQRAIVPPAQASTAGQAREIMAQLGVSGELEVDPKKQAPGRVDFRVGRPGGFFEVHADLEKRIASVNRVQYNFWGTLSGLHHMKVVDPNNPGLPRSWVWTKVWSLSLDALSAGLVFMTLSGIYMWWGKRRRIGGIVALALGFFGCLVFLLR